MAIGMGTALLIGSGIAAGTQAYGAHKASSSAKKAAEQQQQAGREALAMRQQVLGPYAQMGMNVTNRLSDMLMGGPSFAYNPMQTSLMFPSGRVGPGLSRPMPLTLGGMSGMFPPTAGPAVPGMGSPLVGVGGGVAAPSAGLGPGVPAAPAGNSILDKIIQMQTKARAGGGGLSLSSMMPPGAGTGGRALGIF